MGGPLSVIFSDIFMIKMEKMVMYFQGNLSSIVDM